MLVPLFSDQKKFFFACVNDEMVSEDPPPPHRLPLNLYNNVLDRQQRGRASHLFN